MDVPLPAVAVAVATSAGLLDASLLPEGSSVMLGEDGEQYVTVTQDGQTYAIPAKDYQIMQQEGGGTLTIQAPPVPMAQATIAVEHVQQQQQPMVMVPVPKPSFVHHTTPTVPKMEPLLPASPRSFKPIRVDNWGIFLLSRLLNYFQKHEHVDLTLRFPTKDAQIMVHSLVVNACTDYFLEREKEGLVADGGIDMPEEFSPDAVAPLIRFMYTGKLDLKANTFNKLRETADKLGMGVLTKLMDAQLHTLPSLLPQAKKRAGRGKAAAAAENDPVKQIKKIRRIEKRFSTEAKKEQRLIQQQQRTPTVAEQVNQEYASEDSVPGKKLPIWKKRSNQADEPPPTPPNNGTPTKQSTIVKGNLNLTPVSGPPPGAKLVPVSAPPKLSKTLAPTPSPTKALTSPPSTSAPRATPVPLSPPHPSSAIKNEATLKAYKRQSEGFEKPRVPRQVRELQQNMNFEKLRKETMGDTTEAQNEEELSEAMAEQRRRLQEEDDVYDNDAGLDYDEVPHEEDDEQRLQVDKAETSISLPTTPSKPILKTEKTATPDPLKASPAAEQQQTTPTTARKSVRFSLRPGNVATFNPGEASSAVTIQDSASPATDIDTTVDEFSRVADEEEEAEKRKEEEDSKIAASEKRSRSGRPIIRKKQHDEVEAKAETTPPKRGRRPSGESGAGSSVTPPQKKSKKDSVLASPKDGSIDLPVQAAASSKDATTTQIPLPNRLSSSASKVRSNPDQAKMIQNIIKKYPEYLKEHKELRLRIFAKDNHGRQTDLCLTVKAGASGENASFKEITKVCYTGRRGRPKKVQPGDHDPHEEERKALRKEEHHENESEEEELPEKCLNVDFSSSDGSIISVSEVKDSDRSSSSSKNNVEAAMAKLHEEGAVEEKKKANSLAMDWSDDDE